MIEMIEKISEPVLKYSVEVSKPEYSSEIWIYLYEYRRRRMKGIIILIPESRKFLITENLAETFKKALYPEDGQR